MRVVFHFRAISPNHYRLRTSARILDLPVMHHLATRHRVPSLRAYLLARQSRRNALFLRNKHFRL